MRLNILNHGYNAGTKILFAIIKAVSRYPLPDAAKIIFYRPDFYGRPAKKFTQRAMRGPSAWSVGDRELMAAYVSNLNQCSFCIKAHSAVAAQAYNDRAKVDKALADLNTGNIGEPLRATLSLLGKLTRANSIDANDIRTVMAAGASQQQIEDALAVCFAFNVTNRLADALGFFVPGPDAFDAGAKYLLKRGYQ
ncbi:MAG TPA: carboxymuconolactone decarboxylase family protein [Puia sp.]|jgi:uncharacterized peroxidase-related enzyme|nr:carboxymuconolactone decarboxylase family protein [Puia sp.]